MSRRGLRVISVGGLEAAYHGARHPVPIKLARGSATAPDRMELAVLAIVLRAMGALSPEQRQVARAAEVGGKRIEVRVSAPAPRSRRRRS